MKFDEIKLHPILKALMHCACPKAPKQLRGCRMRIRPVL